MNEFQGHLYLADLFTNRFRGFQSYDDIKQVALMGLYEAYLKFKPEKGEFKAYASKCICYAIKDELRNENYFKLPKKILRILASINSKQAFSYQEIMEELSCTKEDVIKALSYKLVSMFDEEVYVSHKDRFEELISSLSFEEKRLVTLKHRYLLTLKDISEITNKSPSVLSRMMKVILEKIKNDCCN